MNGSSRLGFGVVGAGRVGPVLATALAGAGHALVGITKPSDGDLDRVSSIVSSPVFLDAPELLERSELVILAIDDDSLEEFVEGAAKASLWHGGQIVLHTSLRHGLSALEPAQQQGAIPMTLHPLIEFTGTSIDVQRMADSFAVVSAPAVAVPIVQALAVEMGMEPLVISEEQRVSLAQADALARSFADTTIREAAERLKSAGIAMPGLVLGPLVRSSVDNALREVAGNEVEQGLL